jgi:hypothetical protein
VKRLTKGELATADAYLRGIRVRSIATVSETTMRKAATAISKGITALIKQSKR